MVFLINLLLSENHLCKIMQNLHNFAFHLHFGLHFFKELINKDGYWLATVCNSKD